MGIGERLKKLRTDHDFTQEEVANKLKTTKQTLHKYENGIITNIPADRIEKLALIYGVSPAYIMGWEDRQEQEITIETIAAHATGDLTDEEIEEVIRYAKYLKSQRGNK